MFIGITVVFTFIYLVRFMAGQHYDGAPGRRRT